MTYEAVDVEVRVGPAVLLADVSLELRPGEIVAVAGPNGAGKSTLVATLAGDRRPQQGRVTLEGRPTADWPRLDFARRRAVMSADRNVAFAFTAEEVALLGRLPLHGGDPTEADRVVVRGLLEAVDCAHLGGRVFATLSTGERQRVALARAIAQVSEAPGSHPGSALPPGGARYLLLDEPTSSLDPAHQHLAMGLLRRRADAGMGVLAVLHDLNLAAAYADRVVLMAASRVVASGSPTEVLRADLLERVFGIPMLVLPHPHHRHPMVIAEPPLGGE
jgi:iron complex transport system ATP-binding protein